MIAYKVTNRVNGKSYIGITVQGLSARWSQHRHAALHAPKGMLHTAMRKHGVDQFECVEIAVAYSLRELRTLERALISEHGTHKSAGGYNLSFGGEGQWGFRHSAESRAKNAAARRRNWADPAYAVVQRAKLSEAVRRSHRVKDGARTPEARARASRALGAYGRSEEGCRARSERLRDPAQQAKMHAAKRHNREEKQWQRQP